MDNVTSIYPVDQAQKTFSEVEAYKLVSLLIAITSKTKNIVNGLNSQLEFFKGQPTKQDDIQFKINMEMQKWSEKVRRLGATPIAIYKVKSPADNGASYLWEHPKATLESI
jgi:Mg/Co/Ni transporter MgtE